MKLRIEQAYDNGLAWYNIDDRQWDSYNDPVGVEHIGYMRLPEGGLVKSSFFEFAQAVQNSGATHHVDLVYANCAGFDDAGKASVYVEVMRDAERFMELSIIEGAPEKTLEERASLEERLKINIGKLDAAPAMPADYMDMLEEEFPQAYTAMKALFPETYDLLDDIF